MGQPRTVVPQSQENGEWPWPAEGRSPAAGPLPDGRVWEATDQGVSLSNVSLASLPPFRSLKKTKPNGKHIPE